MVHQETSLQAFESIKNLVSLRDRVYLVICKEKGLTCEEIERMLHLSHQTVSARISELNKDLFIKDSKLRRTNISGRSAIVWCING